MSRWPERWVRLAAALLPTHVRQRYREEWLADLDGARELGIPTSSIAIGALLFAATIDRSAPEISGVPLSVAARIHARRGIALILSAGVLAFGAYAGGTRVSFGNPSAAETVLSLLALLIPALAVVAAVAGLIELWRAAFFASLLAKVCAALATVGVASAPLAAIGGWLLMPLALVSLSAATIIGVVAWVGSSQPAQSAVALPHKPGRIPSRPRLPRWAVLAALIVAGLLVAGLAVLPGISMMIVLLATAVVAAGLAVRAVSTPSDERRSRAGSLSMGVMALAVLASVGIGALDLLVLSPEWMAPGFSVTEIYAALTPADLNSGTRMICIWIAFWSVVTLVYLTVTLVAIGNAAPPTHWMLVAGFTIIAAMVFFQWWAGFSLGNSISDTLPPFRGGRHDIGVLYVIVGQFSLVAALWGAIAPRRGGTLRRVRGTGMGPQGSEPRTSGPETSAAGVV
ncbi:MAG: hypothetical protein ACOH19_11615 [Rhodoglobus sp.]